MNDPYAAFTNYLNSGVSYKNTNLLLYDAFFAQSSIQLMVSVAANLVPCAFSLQLRWYVHFPSITMHREARRLVLSRTHLWVIVTLLLAARSGSRGTSS
jgi:hypothetical protein|uniref:Uncharacterized protein n=1 Tax=Picea glauca TaxID=3330 RepID=A0A117NI37_PICGL|nr:hypothetical protein ABT39_MTgene3892 [Picea glauca]QHR86712.1 hypothetical protein Q903MT_gene716 [Picea sitchensis]